MAESAPWAQPMPLRALLDEAVRQARRHFGRIYLPVALPLALVAGLLALVQGQYYAAVGVDQRSADLAGVLPRLGLVMAGTFVFLLAFGLGYGALVAGAVDAVAGREVSMKRAWSLMFRPRVLGTLLLCWMGFAVGLMCCLAPGVYLGVLWSLVVPVMIEERVFGPGAMGRSADLVRYNPQRDVGADPRLKVFLLVFVGYIAAYAVGLLVQAPVIAIQWVAMWRGIASGQRVDPHALAAQLTWLQVPSQMLGMLTQTAVHLYVSLGLVLIYFDVRMRKEGADLERAIAGMTGTPSVPEGPVP